MFTDVSGFKQRACQLHGLLLTLAHSPVTPFIENFVVTRNEFPFLYCHTLSSNYVLNIPEIPTSFTREARVFVPEYTVKSAIFGVKFSQDGESSARQ